MNRKRTPLRINIMTATLAPGDAIGNYILSQARLLQGMGAKVNIYADHVSPQLAKVALSSSLYQPNDVALLWYHYSIYADNLALVEASTGYRIMDFHGISPPHLFHQQNEHLAYLCEMGLERLPTLAQHFDRFVVHSDYTQQQLEALAYPGDRIHKIALAVDRSRLLHNQDQQLAALLQKLDYLLFVGRVVPQKDILASLDIFAEIQQSHPNMLFVIIGSQEHTPRYEQQIKKHIGKLGLENRILFTGQVNNPALLSAFFEYATFYLATSEWESFCVPLAESLSFGVPAVVPAVPPLPEVAGPGGIVINKENPVEAAGKIIDVLEDKERYQQLRQEAQKWSARYSDEALGQNLESLLRRIAVEG